MIYFDEIIKAIYYFTEGNNPKRVNLRNGEEVDLMTLKKIEKVKDTNQSNPTKIKNESTFMKTATTQMTEAIIFHDNYADLD